MRPPKTLLKAMKMGLLILAASFAAVGAGGQETREAGVCGGIQGVQCPQANQFCELPAGECGSADLQGTCVVRPEVCTREFVPVCGCDGTTYGNDCERRRAGVQKDHGGECMTKAPKR